MKACLNTLHTLLSTYPEVLNDKTIKILDEIVFFLTQCLESPFCNKDIQLAQKIVKTTVGILDIFVLDEMQPRYKEKIGGMVYGRAGRLFEEDARKILPFALSDQPLAILPMSVTCTHYVFFEEIKEYFKNLAQDTHITSVRSPIELKRLLRINGKNRSRIFYFSSFLSKEKIGEVVNVVGKKDKIMLILPFLLNRNFAGFALAGSRARLVDNDIFLPQSEPSRQDILEVMLHGGIPLIHSRNKAVAKDRVAYKKILSSKETITQLKDMWEEISSISMGDRARHTTAQQAKKYSLLSGKKRQLYTAYLKKSIKKNYAHLFLRSYRKKPGSASEVFLTRSGLSATTLGVYTAAEFFENAKKVQPCMYVNKGFYYEADTIVKRIFTTIEYYKNKKIKIFCTNVSSNSPYTTLKKDYDYAKNRDLLIAYVLKLARLHPRIDYFLIVDKTTDLFFETISTNVSQPKNVYLFEVASLTKYRWGDHNHFSGVAIYKGDKKMIHYIKKALKSAHGVLSERDLYFFLKLTRTGVNKIITGFRQKSQAFASSFNTVINTLPPYLRWRIESNSDSPHYIFIIPPMKTMIASALEKRFFHLFFKNKPQNERISKIYECYKSYLKKIIYFVIDPFYSTAGFERGSSFGLKTTRVTLIPGEFEFRQRIFSQKITRISFGMNTSLKQLRSFGKKLAGELIGKTVTQLKTTTI